jgi:hypothetical protein
MVTSKSANKQRSGKPNFKFGTKIPAMSKVRHARMKEYLKARKKFLAVNRKCKRCGKPSTEIHHSRGRIGRLLLMEEHWVALDRCCHNWVGDNPVEAREAGLLCELGQWNTP